MLDHLTSFSSSRESISWPGLELPTTPFSLGTFSLSSYSLRSSRTRPHLFVASLHADTNLKSASKEISFIFEGKTIKQLKECLGDMELVGQSVIKLDHSWAATWWLTAKVSVKLNRISTH